MAVAQDHGLSRHMEPVSVDQRMARRLDDFDILDSDPRELVGDKLGSAADIISVLGQSADAGDTKQVFEFAQEPLPVLIRVTDC